MSYKASLAGLAISAALCLGTLLLWGRSYFFEDDFSYINDSCTFGVGIDSHQGELEVRFITYTNMPKGLLNGLGGWNSQANNLGWRYLTLRSLLDFRWNDTVITYSRFANGTSATMHFRTAGVPTWTLMAMSVPLPAGILWRGRRKVRWGLRKDVVWRSHRLRMRITRFALFSAAGVLLGAIVGWLDIEFKFSRTPWVWTVVLFCLMPVVVLSAVFTRRRIPWHRALLWMSLELAGCLCFFQATIERVSRNLIVFWYYDPDLPRMVLFVGLVCFVFGAVLLLFLQVKPEPVKAGPYCPECGYCLIGLPKQICSECGRPFTLEGLGIVADELVPGRMSRA